ALHADDPEGTLVPVEVAGDAVVRHVQVGLSVAVVISEGHAEAPTRRGFETQNAGRVPERPVTPVNVEASPLRGVLLRGAGHRHALLLAELAARAGEGNVASN